MQAPGNKKTKTARVWTYIRDERPWSGQSPPCAWYQFTIDRKGEHPVSHLAGYKGWVHADGYSGFNGLFGDNKANEMACMAHVRCKFVDVFASQGNAVAEEAIRRIAELYGVEKEIRGKTLDERVTVRQNKAKPIFDSLEDWLHTQLPKISGESPLAQGIRYALGRMLKARPYLENGHLELDNNVAERRMKPVAIGQKNWMFAGSEGGSKAMAIAFTLIETAKLNKSIHRHGSPGFSAKSQITKSHGWTNCSPGVTLPKQRNRQNASPTGRVQRTVSVIRQSRRLRGQLVQLLTRTLDGTLRDAFQHWRNE